VTTAKIDDDAVTTAKILDANVTPAKLSQPLTLETAQATTSGTSIDFTSIPSWAKRITVMLNGVSTNGTDSLLIQVGDGSIKTSNYYGYGMAVETTVTGTLDSSAGCLIEGTGASAQVRFGVVTLSRTQGNTWSYAGQLGIFGSTAARMHMSAGGTGSALSATLDRIRLTTVNGTDTFDAGAVNIMYEG
jgi:hypothetical protein